MEKTPQNCPVVESDKRENEVGDKQEEEYEAEEEDEQVLPPIDPRVIKLLDILVKESHEDAVKQRVYGVFK